ncbi:MAG: class I SAM-dependent methyltransferase [Eubacteriales bacterium]|nr:class I SAM-dependent methyltransferase [Eubacteriales bacterium]
MGQNVKDFYDIIAEEYARLYFNELEKKPFDRSILLRFSELTRDMGTVCDIGCGPGQIGHFLNQNGVKVIGIDVSEKMIKEARKLYPGIDFEQGDMFSLRFDDSYLAGIVTFYAIVHLFLMEVELVLREFKRVIMPGGFLLISFHIGEESIKVDKIKDDITASAVYMFFNQDVIFEKIEQAGFVIEEAIIRYPYKDVEYQSKRAYVLARKVQ